MATKGEQEGKMGNREFVRVADSVLTCLQV